MSYIALKKLLEEDGQIQDNPTSAKEFGPTAKFRKIYGHYCGPGNEGGEPIDDLDAACEKHDKCYFSKGRDDCDCDDCLIDDVDKFLKNGKLRFKQRLYGELIKRYFHHKINHGPCKH
jgi:hypothetical protein